MLWRFEVHLDKEKKGENIEQENWVRRCGSANVGWPRGFLRSPVASSARILGMKAPNRSGWRVDTGGMTKVSGRAFALPLTLVGGGRK